MPFVFAGDELDGVKPSPLERKFYLRATEKVAKDLLGAILCVRTSRGVIRSKIVETEAYLGTSDEACHSFRGVPTARTRTMFDEGGHAYVYFIYGMHFCLNVVTREKGVPEAVLIRAVEPLLQGEEPTEKVKKKIASSTNGPGKLARYLEIDREDDGLDLCSPRSRIWIEERPEKVAAKEITTGARIGIDSKKSAKDLPLRYYLHESPHVSRRLRGEAPPLRN